MNIILTAFKFTLNISIAATITALLIFLIKFIVRDKFGAKWSFLIWLILVIKLLTPLAPTSQFSIFNLSGLVTKSTSKVNSIFITSNIAINNFNSSKGDAAHNNSLNTAISGHDLKLNSITNNLKNAKDIALSVWEVASLIWIIIIIVLLCLIIKPIIILKRKISICPCTEENKVIDVFNHCKEQMHISQKIDLVTSDVVSMPGVFGIIHPKLLIPKSISDKLSHKELEHIIFHELAHIKRKDSMINLLTYLLQIIHWFNPLIAYSFRCMRNDAEIACDAMGLEFVGVEDSKDYGYTMLKLMKYNLKDTSKYIVSNFFSDKSNIKRRITMISVFKNNSYKLTAAATVVTIALGCLTLTNAQAQTNQNNNPVSSKAASINNVNPSHSPKGVNGKSLPLKASNNRFSPLNEKEALNWIDKDAKPVNDISINPKAVHSHKLKAHDIVAIKNIKNYSVVIYQFDKFNGSFALTKSMNRILPSAIGSSYYNMRGSFIVSNSEITEQAGAGSLSYFYGIINDKNILKKAYSAEVVFKNNSKDTELFNNKRAVIFQGLSSQISTITIKDSSGNIVSKVIYTYHAK